MPSEALERLVRERLQVRWPYASVRLSPPTDGEVRLRAELTLVSLMPLGTAMLDDELTPDTWEFLAEQISKNMIATMERVLREQLDRPAVDVST